jgi:hypothetical protein
VFNVSVLFTDEAMFTRESVFNYHNEHVWAGQNAHAARKSHLQRNFSVNLWAGIVGGTLFGPHMLPARLTGELYLRFLDNDLPLLLENVPLDIRGRMWYMHDGAPTHFSRVIRGYLDEHYPQRWIGRGGPVAWQPRSPDLNPLDY